MRLERYSSAEAFLDAITPALSREEARNSLILGIVARLIRDPAYAPDAYLVRVADEEKLVLAAMRTPPWGLVLTDCAERAEEAVDLLIADVVKQDNQPPDVNGPKALSLRFAQGWAAITGGSHALKMEQGLYELVAVNPAALAAAPGKLRTATKEDVPLILAWREGFELDAFGKLEGDRERIRELYEQRYGDVYFWEEQGEPVSMAMRTRPSARGITVGLVYTPPAQRRKGYASACVAHLSQLLLDEGYAFCTLYTDLANATSNAIYQHIGYRRIADVDAHVLIRHEK
jgi:hypothetical protein